MTDVRGEIITLKDGRMTVPNHPILPYIEGDGTGPDIWRASVRVFDAAVAKAYGASRKIHWLEVLAGQKAFDQTGSWLPDETLDAFRRRSFSLEEKADDLSAFLFGCQTPHLMSERSAVIIANHQELSQ